MLVVCFQERKEGGVEAAVVAGKVLDKVDN
jgi:hypothetical protein